LTATFPDAIPVAVLVKRAVSVLEQHGFTSDNTLLATSVCCDEANRVLELEFAKIYGEHFSMGGLSGFPFGGNTSFNAMASHIPTNGHCLIVYGSHVGIDNDGNVGRLSRRGKVQSDDCCGSGVAALNYVQKVMKGEIESAALPLDPIEVQQWFVGHLLLQQGDRLEKAQDPQVELPKALFDGQVDLIHKIVQKSGSAVATGRIALLGGIQVNTPPGLSDFFVPMKFELFSNQGKLLNDLMWKQT
jgi:hypothetical protein